MDIINIRKERRRNQINQIKTSIQKAMSETTELNFKTISLAVMSNLNLSNRTSKEYVELALFELGLDKNFERRI